jgi:hypothetical protein
MSKKKRMERRKSVEDKPVWAVVLHDVWDHEKLILTDAMTYEQAKIELGKKNLKDNNEISYYSIEQIKIVNHDLGTVR